jgi:transposase
MKTDTAYQEKSKEELLKLLVEKDIHITQQVQQITHQTGQLTQQAQQITQQVLQITEQAQQIQSLNELIRLYCLRQFSNKSEKISPDQLSLFDEGELPKRPDAIEEAEEEISVASYVRKKQVGRKPLPANLPREQQTYDLEENEKTCRCGCELTHIKDEKSEQLEIIPPKIYVIEHVRKKYACRKCEETIKTALMPKQPIPRSIAGPGLLSHVIVSKFQDHLPLFRQEKILRRIGVDIPRSTLCLWIIRSHELLQPMMNLIKRTILCHEIAYSDETTVQVLKEPNKGVKSKKYMWLFAGGSPEKFSYYYHYHPKRSLDVLLAFFDGYKGYIHCDGYGGYDALADRSSDITLSGCMYHVRRKFVEIVKISNAKEGVAHTVVGYITKLARIEEEIKTLSANDRKAIRHEKEKPILDTMHRYLSEMQPKTYPKSALGAAISYALNQWPKLLIYLQDGRLENNNNRSERAIKPFVIGRKGWLFADSVTGAQAAATLFSLVETCKHHNVDPYSWFRYVLQQMPLCQSESDIEALLPFNIDQALLGRSEV